MYYLFKKGKELETYRREFQQASEAIKSGVTPVYSEIRSCKSSMVESIPYNILSAVFIVSVSEIINKGNMPSTVQMAVLLVANNFCCVLANYIFTMLKHRLRLSLCKRLEILPTEHNIAVMESLEYQSVITEEV